MKSNKKRLLVLSAPIGSGHTKAAEALCCAYIDKFKGEAVNVNFLNYLNPTFSRLAEKSYFLMIKYAPIIYKLIYENTDKPNKSIKTIGNYFNIKKYGKLIEEYKPDIILSTHYIPAAFVSWMHQRFPISNGVVITDFDSHSMWVYPDNDRIFIGCKEMITDLERVGIKKNKLCVSGIPVHSNFRKSFDIKKIKRKLGLNLEIPTILLMSGGNATGPFNKISKSLSKIKLDFQTVVITGKNQKMEKKLKEYFKLLGLKGKVLGFVNNVEEYMAASRLLISKAGGLTVTEALTIGLPMLIIRPTPGQEDGNTQFLTKSGAAIHIKSADKIGLVVDELLRNPIKINQMSKQVKKLARPTAAEKILEEMELIYKKSPAKSLLQ